MMIIPVVKKSLKQIFRNRSSLFFIFVAPVIFFAFFSLIFGGHPSAVDRSIGYMNLDQGNNGTLMIPHQFHVSQNTSQYGALFIDLLDHYPNLLTDSPIHLHLVAYADTSALIHDLQGQNIAIGFVLPANFSKSILSDYNEKLVLLNGTANPSYPTAVTSTVTVYGDPSVQVYQSTYSLLSESYQAFANRIYGNPAITHIQVSGGNLKFHNEAISNNNLTEFDYVIPGFIVFFVIIQMIDVSTQLGQEQGKHTIQRLKLSKIGNWELFIGIVISQLIITTIQLLLSVPVLWVLHFRHSVIEWTYAFVILQLMNINLSGIALLIASVGKNAEDANKIAGLLATPLGFLSGAFLPVPAVWLVKSLNIQFWDLIPPYEANVAVSKIFLEQATLLDVSRQIGFLLVYTIIWLLIGLIVYQKRVIQADT